MKVLELKLWCFHYFIFIIMIKYDVFHVCVMFWQLFWQDAERCIFPLWCCLVSILGKAPISAGCQVVMTLLFSGAISGNRSYLLHCTSKLCGGIWLWLQQYQCVMFVFVKQLEYQHSLVHTTILNQFFFQIQ